METAQINLNYTRIVAPFDGIVTSRSVDVGQLVTASNTSSTPLFTVTDQSKLRIYVHVPQNDSYLIKPGMTTNFTVPEYPGRPFPPNGGQRGCHCEYQRHTVSAVPN